MDMSHQLQAPATLPPWKQTVPGTQWIGGWVDLRVGVDAMEKKIKSCLCWESNPGHPAQEGKVTSLYIK
jgi:hypothetical protein